MESGRPTGALSCHNELYPKLTKNWPREEKGGARILAHFPSHLSPNRSDLMHYQTTQGHTQPALWPLAGLDKRYRQASWQLASARPSEETGRCPFSVLYSRPRPRPSGTPGLSGGPVHQAPLLSGPTSALLLPWVHAIHSRFQESVQAWPGEGDPCGHSATLPAWEAKTS